MAETNGIKYIKQIRGQSNEPDIIHIPQGIHVPCGFELSDDELHAAEKFIKEHREKHGSCPYTITFDCTSGIGIGVSIVCTQCGEYRDITDYGSW